MSGYLRRQVLSTFKKLHRTRLNTFRDDFYALEVARKKINEEYKKSRDVTDEKAIAELNEFAKAVEVEVRTRLVQAKEVEPGKFEVRITPETETLDNADVDTNGCSNSTKKNPATLTKCSGSTNTS